MKNFVAAAGAVGARAFLTAGLMLTATGIASTKEAAGPDVDLPAASDAGAQEGEALAAKAGEGLVGKLAPRLVLRTVDGGTIDLGADYGRRPVYLKFWATWCGPCRMQMPHFQDTFARSGGDMEIVAVDTGLNDSVEKVLAYRKRMGLGMPVVVDDGTAAAAFHLRVTPQHVVIGRDGRILHIGHSVDDKLERALEEARRPADATPVTLAGPGTATLARPANAVALTGETVDLRGRTGSPANLVFMSTWCEWYLAETRPRMSSECKAATESLAGAGSANRATVLVLSGIWTKPEEVRNFVARNGIQVPTVFDVDGAIFRGFGVNRVPTRLSVDASGEVAERLEGIEASRN